MSETKKIRMIAGPLKQSKEKREQKKDDKRKNFKSCNNTVVLTEKCWDTKQVIDQKKPDRQRNLVVVQKIFQSHDQGHFNLN